MKLKRKPNNSYEKRHLENPAFLEKYFQKKPVFLCVVIVLAPLFVWLLGNSIADLLGWIDDSDASALQDILFIVGIPLLFALVYQEYLLYRDNLWNRTVRKRTKQ